MTTKLKPNEVYLRRVRLGYPKLYKPAEDQNGKLQWSCQFRIEDEENRKKVEAAVLYAATEKWGKKAPAVLAEVRRNSGKNIGARTFNDSRDGTEYFGVNAKKPTETKSGTPNQPPKLLTRNPKIPSQPGGPESLYAGCYVNAIVSAWAYDNVAKGVSFNLGGVQFVEDGEPFGGERQYDESDFEDLSGESAAKEGDDELPPW
jgi:hypothetical protein